MEYPDYQRLQRHPAGQQTQLDNGSGPPRSCPVIHVLNDGHSYAPNGPMVQPFHPTVLPQHHQYPPAGYEAEQVQLDFDMAMGPTPYSPGSPQSGWASHPGSPTHTEYSYSRSDCASDAELTVASTSAAQEKRKALNRAAQRAFRHRRDKRSKDLAMEIATLTEKYDTLQSSKDKLEESYVKLHKTFEVLIDRENTSASPETEMLRKLLSIHAYTPSAQSSEPRS